MYIYKFLGEGNEVLYVGKTTNLLKRMKQHFRSEYKEWKKNIKKIYYAKCINRTEMDIQEVYLINKLSPKYNKKDKRDDDVSTIKLRFLNFNALNIQDLLSEKIIRKFHLEYEISLFTEYRRRLKEASDITMFSFFEDIGDLEPMPIEVNNNTVAIYEELRKKVEIKEEKSKKK